MPNAKEIKNRINSVNDTKKITNAMYLIASTKLSKARRDLDNTRPFFNALSDEVKRIFRVNSDVQSKYFYPRGHEMTHDGVYGFLVVTADKGLAGAYNMNVLKETKRLLEQHSEHRLYVVGSVGRAFLENHGYAIEKNFEYTAANPTLSRAREITYLLLEDYFAGKVDKIYIVYTDMKNGMETEPVVTRLLPFHRTAFLESKVEREINNAFEFVPSLSAVLDNVMPTLLTGYLYSALVDSFCAEQNDRMSAMDSANRNADKLLTELSVEYNRVRQAAITQEITEISAGAKAMKRKKMKKKGTKA